MDILHLIDRLEAMVMDSARIPVVGKIMLDPQELLDLVDSMRLAVPESLKEAERIVRNREQSPSRATVTIGSVAQEFRAAGLSEPEVLRLAEQRARDLVEQTERECELMVEEARRRAEQHLTDAENQATAIRAGADEYALEALNRLEHQLSNMITTVQRGVEQLERDRAGR